MLTESLVNDESLIVKTGMIENKLFSFLNLMILKPVKISDAAKKHSRVRKIKKNKLVVLTNRPF